MFGTVFSQGGKEFYGGINSRPTPTFINGSTDSITHPPQKLNLKPLLDSPKKSKTNKKKQRLYINKKKVPKWAEDFNELAKVYGSDHQKKLRS